MVRYFNITYKCNQKCLFCAADLFEHNNEEMTLKEFSDIVNKAQMKKGDKVILNGGEPTCSSYFKEIIDFCKDKELRIDLFTNGRYFKDLSRCEQIFNKGSFYIRVPLFGMEMVHDNLTGNKGNFKETISGIENISKYYGNKETLEIKLLLSKETVKHNLSIIKYLKSLGIADNCTFSLNPLIISKSVLKNYNIFCDDYSNLMQKSYSLLEYCKEYSIDIITPLVPICILPKQFKNDLIKNYCSQSTQVFFNDKYNIDTDVVNNTFGSYEVRCMDCDYCDLCPKYSRTYLEYRNGVLENE